MMKIMMMMIMSDVGYDDVADRLTTAVPPPRYVEGPVTRPDLRIKDH